MPNHIKSFDNSNRSTMLINAILPYLQPGNSVLDVGCGYSAYPTFQGTTLPNVLHEKGLSYHGIDNRADVIAQCKAEYPWGEWTTVDASKFVAAHKYDALFHLGFDRKDLSDAWLIHQNLHDSGNGPRVVLLEAGSPIGVPSKHIESFREVQVLYVKWGYTFRTANTYTWSYKVTQPARHFAIMEFIG